MNRRLSVRRLSQSARVAPAGLLAAVLFATGCMHQQTRGQAEDEVPADRYNVRTVGEWTEVGNATPVPVGGIGLVVNLDGTGAEPAQDQNRSILEKELRVQGYRDIKKLLASNEVALVLVSAVLPPGCRKGDKIDVEVTLPPGSQAKSLRGGYLAACPLRNHEFAANLNNDFRESRSIVDGHVLAHAEGPLLVGLGAGEDGARLRAGRLWGGAISRIDTPFTLMLKEKHQFATKSKIIADQLNETFQYGGPNGGPVAYTRDNMAVWIRVPPQYRLNMTRYLRVVRLVPVRGNAEPGTVEGMDSYRQKLAEDLLDPARTVTAALRLEALGRDSIAVMKKALTTSQDPLVRFCAAESLAYLGSTTSADDLARMAVEQPAVRAFALTALASLDKEAVCLLKLRELVETATDDETRYGAFRALRELDDQNPAVQGVRLNDAFWVHRVAPQTPPLVHLTTSKRAEIVLFGEDARLVPECTLLAGEFTITSREGDDHCVVTRVYPRGGEAARKEAPLLLEAVLRAMAELGATYPDVTEMIRQAEATGVLSCRVRTDALPQAVSVQDLARAGRRKPGEEALLQPRPELGSTPNLYAGPRQSRMAGESALLKDRTPADSGRQSARRPARSDE